jgi:tagaturonate reductase
LLKELWATGDTRKVAEGVLAAEYIWKENLNITVLGLTELVKRYLDLILEKGMYEAVKTIL